MEDEIDVSRAIGPMEDEIEDSGKREVEDDVIKRSEAIVQVVHPCDAQVVGRDDLVDACVACEIRCINVCAFLFTVLMACMVIYLGS
jgi:hypothetical protein